MGPLPQTPPSKGPLTTAEIADLIQEAIDNGLRDTADIRNYVNSTLENGGRFYGRTMLNSQYNSGRQEFQRRIEIADKAKASGQPTPVNVPEGATQVNVPVQMADGTVAIIPQVLTPDASKLKQLRELAKELWGFDPYEYRKSTTVPTDISLWIGNASVSGKAMDPGKWLEWVKTVAKDMELIASGAKPTMNPAASSVLNEFFTTGYVAGTQTQQIEDWNIRLNRLRTDLIKSKSEFNVDSWINGLTSKGNIFRIAYQDRLDAGTLNRAVTFEDYLTMPDVEADIKGLGDAVYTTGYLAKKWTVDKIINELMPDAKAGGKTKWDLAARDWATSVQKGIVERLSDMGGAISSASSVTFDKFGFPVITTPDGQQITVNLPEVPTKTMFLTGLEKQANSSLLTPQQSNAAFREWATAITEEANAKLGTSVAVDDEVLARVQEFAKIRGQSNTRAFVEHLMEKTGQKPADGQPVDRAAVQLPTDMKLSDSELAAIMFKSMVTGIAANDLIKAEADRIASLPADAELAGFTNYVQERVASINQTSRFTVQFSQEEIEAIHKRAKATGSTGISPASLFESELKTRTALSQEVMTQSQFKDIAKSVMAQYGFADITLDEIFEESNRLGISPLVRLQQRIDAVDPGDRGSKIGLEVNQAQTIIRSAQNQGVKLDENSIPSVVAELSRGTDPKAVMTGLATISAAKTLGLQLSAEANRINASIIAQAINLPDLQGLFGGGGPIDLATLEATMAKAGWTKDELPDSVKAELLKLGTTVDPEKELGNLAAALKNLNPQWTKSSTAAWQAQQAAMSASQQARWESVDELFAQVGLPGAGFTFRPRVISDPGGGESELLSLPEIQLGEGFQLDEDVITALRDMPSELEGFRQQLKADPNMSNPTEAFKRIGIIKRKPAAAVPANRVGGFRQTTGIR